MYIDDMCGEKSGCFLQHMYRCSGALFESFCGVIGLPSGGGAYLQPLSATIEYSLTFLDAYTMPQRRVQKILSMRTFFLVSGALCAHISTAFLLFTPLDSTSHATALLTKQ